MSDFADKQLSAKPEEIAPDGLEVRTLLRTSGGSMAHFQLPPGQTSMAVAHHTVEEIWYFLSGSGKVWRKLNDRETVTQVKAGVCITIPVGTHFQIRSFGHQPLAAVGITMPPWPGAEEAYRVTGRWSPTVASPSSMPIAPHEKPC